MNAPQTSSVANNAINGAPGAFSPEVVAFAAAHQGEHCLQPLLEATHRIFPTANFVKVHVVEDPELSYNTQIVFHVQVVGLPLDQARMAGDQWNQEMVRLYPPLREFLFCLRLDLKH